MFKLEITTIEDFIKFVCLIRDENLDVNEIKSLTEMLNKSANELDNAVKQGEDNVKSGS